MKEEITLNIQLSPLALKLRTLRIHKRLSTKDLARICNVDEADIIDYETDREVPSEIVKRELLDFLNS